MSASNLKARINTVNANKKARTESKTESNVIALAHPVLENLPQRKADGSGYEYVEYQVPSAIGTEGMLTPLLSLMEDQGLFFDKDKGHLALASGSKVVLSDGKTKWTPKWGMRFYNPEANKVRESISTF